MGFGPEHGFESPQTGSAGHTDQPGFDSPASQTGYSTKGYDDYAHGSAHAGAYAPPAKKGFMDRLRAAPGKAMGKIKDAFGKG